LKSKKSHSLDTESLSGIDNNFKKSNLLAGEKEKEFNTGRYKSKNDAEVKISEKRNSKKNHNFKEIINNDQKSIISNKKLDFTNFEENKNDSSNLNLLKQQSMVINQGLNISPSLNALKAKNNNNKNNNDNLPSEYIDLEEEKIDFSEPNGSILQPDKKNNDNKSFNNTNNKTLKQQNAYAVKKKTNIYEEEEAKNKYVADNQEENDASGIGFLINNESKRTNTLNLVDSPDIRNKYKNSELLNQINSNNNSYFDNNMSSIQNIDNSNIIDANYTNNNLDKHTAVNYLKGKDRENKQTAVLNNSKINNNKISSNDSNNLSNLNLSSINLVDAKNIATNNNIGKSKLVDNIVKGKNTKNFANLLMNKKSNL